MATETHADDTGLRVDALRVERAISKQRLAAEARIAYPTLERRLLGDGNLTVAELRRISSVLNVSPASWFLEASA